MPRPLVAIVGRPNVGKSMLFNKLTGQRAAIVEDTPGVTRDRIYGTCEWRGRTFDLMDTGGIEPGTDSEILQFMRRQAEIGIELADASNTETDVKVGHTAADRADATILQRARKPVALAVNKCDSVGGVNPDIYEFYSLGLGDPFEVSAVHGHGTGDLLDWCVDHFPEETVQEEDEDLTRVAIVGKPNVGKSSLLNQILGEERVIVSDMAGTTRDAIDSYFENSFGKYCFIDTAGMRRRSKVDDAIERYSNLRSVSAIERADGAGHQDCGLGPRGGQGGAHCCEQMGPGGKGDQHHAGHGGPGPPGLKLYALCPGGISFRSYRPAGGQAL